MLSSFFLDIRYGLRLLAKSPGISLNAILTLALAIGGNTLMFTVIHAVLLKPLQYRDPDRLVSLEGGATPWRFREMKTATHSFTEIGAYSGPET